jgi:hypothetical protein
MNSIAQRSIGGGDIAAINTSAQLSAEQGRYGYDIISDTAAHTPPAGHSWCRIHAVTAVVIAASILAADPVATGTLTGTVIAGDEFSVFLSSITLTSGTLIAYRDR